MKQSFEDFFNSLSQEKLTEQWNLALKEKKKKNKISIVLIVVADLLILYNLLFIMPFNAQTIMFFIISCFILDMGILIIESLFNTKNTKKYNEIFKSEIVDKILKNFFDDVDYIPLKPIPSAIYKEGIYEPYDIYHSDDYMEGKMDNKFPIKMAEVLTEEVDTERDSEGNTTTTTRTLFSGIFAKIDIQKSINNELKISTNNFIKNKNRLEMDSSEFEKYFDVSSTDKIIGMQLLTHDIMEILVNYRRDQGKPFDILLKNNLLYIRFHIGPVFETNINNNTAIDKNTVEKYFNIVRFIYVLSKQMINVVNETQV